MIRQRMEYHLILLITFLNRPNKYNVRSVTYYYPNFSTPENFSLSYSLKVKILNTMKNIKIFKPFNLDKLSERFVRNGAKVLWKPILELCNLLTYQAIFQNFCIILKLQQIYKKETRQDLLGIARMVVIWIFSWQVSYCLLCLTFSVSFDVWFDLSSKIFSKNSKIIESLHLFLIANSLLTNLLFVTYFFFAVWTTLFSGGLHKRILSFVLNILILFTVLVDVTVVGLFLLL